MASRRPYRVRRTKKPKEPPSKSDREAWRFFVGVFFLLTSKKHSEKGFQAALFNIIAFSVAERRREEKCKDVSLKFKLHDCRRAHNNVASTLIHSVSKAIFLKVKSCNWSKGIIQNYKKQCNSL